MSSRSAANSAAYDSRRARIAMSADGRSLSFGKSSIRTSSRSRRFSWFRATAVCWCRGTTTPTRECARGEARARTSRCMVRIRFPSRMTVCRSRPRVSRLRRGNRKPWLGACVLAWQLNGEALAPLLTAAAEHCTTPLGLHASAKPVSLDAALVARAISRLTHGQLPKRCERTCGADR
jgi:hypothetical protein